MAESVIPYADSREQGLTPRGLFGVVVRTVGLLIELWGLYALVYGVVLGVAKSAMATAGTELAPSYVMSGVVMVLVGLPLLRGEWVVRMAYGPMRQM